MEYLTNVELLMLIGGLVLLIITYLGYKGIVKSKGLPDNPVIDETFEQTKDVLIDKIQVEIAETKEEIKKKKTSKKVVKNENIESSNNTNNDNLVM